MPQLRIILTLGATEQLDARRATLRRCDHCRMLRLVHRPPVVALVNVDPVPRFRPLVGDDRPRRMPRHPRHIRIALDVELRGCALRGDPPAAGIPVQHRVRPAVGAVVNRPAKAQRHIIGSTGATQLVRPEMLRGPVRQRELILGFRQHEQLLFQLVRLLCTGNAVFVEVGLKLLCLGRRCGEEREGQHVREPQQRRGRGTRGHWTSPRRRVAPSTTISLLVRKHTTRITTSQRVKWHPPQNSAAGTTITISMMCLCGVIREPVRLRLFLRCAGLPSVRAGSEPAAKPKHPRSRTPPAFLTSCRRTPHQVLLSLTRSARQRGRRRASQGAVGRRDNLVDEAIVDGLLRRHVVVVAQVLLDALARLPRHLGVHGHQRRLDLVDLLRLHAHVLRLARER
eukprot:1281625-Prymnesium_polylepis.2